MVHYLRFQDGTKYQVSMECGHPDSNGHSTDGLSCNGDCEACKHSVARTDVKSMLRLIHEAGADRL